MATSYKIKESIDFKKIIDTITSSDLADDDLEIDFNINPDEIQSDTIPAAIPSITPNYVDDTITDTKSELEDQFFAKFGDCDTVYKNDFIDNKWCVVKIMTDCGVKLAIDKQDTTKYDVVCCNLSYETSIEKLKELMISCKCGLFDNTKDVVIGNFSKHVIIPIDSKTSYK